MTIKRENMTIKERILEIKELCEGFYDTGILAVEYSLGSISVHIFTKSLFDELAGERKIEAKVADGEYTRYSFEENGITYFRFKREGE